MGSGTNGELTAGKRKAAKSKIVTSEILDRQPPRNLEAEKGVLGSILLLPEVCDEVALIVRPADFYDEANQKLFAHMQAIHDAGRKVDLTLLIERLHTSGDFELVGGAGYLAEIARSVPYASNAMHYAGIVREQADLRRLRLASEDLMRGVYSGTGAATLLGLTTQTLDAIRAGANPADRIAKPVAVESLISDNPRLGEPIIDGVLRKGETGNIIADPKRGKSWLAYGLALSICIGDKWLGTFDCVASRVLIIDNELAPATLAHRIPAAADAMAIRLRDYADRLDVLSLRGRLVDLYGIARLLEAIEPGRYGLVILDALYRALPVGTSENDNAEMAMLFNTIDKITSRLNCGWVNIHHAGKGEQGGKSVVDVGAGAGSQARAADSHLILRPHEEDGAVVLEAAVRSFPPVEPLPMRFTFPIWAVDEALDPKKVRGRLTKQEQRQTGKDQEGTEKLYSALAGGRATVRVLRGRTGLSKDRCERLLDRLESRGEVEWDEITARGNRTREYRFKEQTNNVVSPRGHVVDYERTT